MAKIEDILDALQTNITEEKMNIGGIVSVICKPTDLTGLFVVVFCADRIVLRDELLWNW